MASIVDMSDEIGAIRSILAAHLPWSPLDFIRRINADGDRSIHAEFLTAELSEEDDLRFISRSSKGVELAVFARQLPWDSEFFGCRMARLDGVFPLNAPWYRPNADYTGAIAHLVENAKARDVRYLFASVDPRDLATLRALGSLGFSLIETRVCYHRDLTDYSPTERYPVRIATADDVAGLERTAQAMANPYDRFHADPFFDPSATDRLMRRWVQASIRDGFADVTIVPAADQPTAFCTVRYHKDRWDRWGLNLGQPVFSAVGPEFKGWYRKIISEIGYHLRDVGAEHSYLITQVTNGAVIWVWESLGYRFGRGEHIMRISL